MSISLHDALKVEICPDKAGGYHCYKANTSNNWNIRGIPHGGYVVGIILSATNDLQSNTAHPDPVHLTAHYLRPVDLAECEVHIKVTRSGKKYTNIDADIIQKGQIKIAARIIYGELPDLTQTMADSSDNLTLAPSSPYGRRIPLSQHPAFVTLDEPNLYYLYQNKADDRFFDEQNAKRAERQQHGNTHPPYPDCGVEWGTWYELTDPADRLEIAMIPLFADCMKNLPSLLPPELQPGPSWFATVVLTVEFKSRIPASITSPNTTDLQYSPRTVGIYASSRFLTEGRHDELVEIWTAPSTIGSNGPGSREIDPNWREKQVCLAVSTQMALTIPDERSRRSRL